MGTGGISPKVKRRQRMLNLNSDDSSYLFYTMNYLTYAYAFSCSNVTFVDA